MGRFDDSVDSGLSASEFVDKSDYSIKVWSLVSTILGGGVVLTGSIFTEAATTFVELHLWALSALAGAFAGLIRAAFGGGAYIQEQAWLGAYLQAKNLGALAPWLLVLDLVVVVGIVYVARRWLPV